MHLGDHIRAAFDDWVAGGMQEQVSIRMNGSTKVWESEKLLELVWQCSDVMPDDLCATLGVEPGGTYGRWVQARLQQAR
ncbi:unannotated protein [freshwater metagenome]|uniref:Unannotated protein n=1 Tax=freshwater metagenome TaxID=449393 RepID=A0A6J7HIK5_9ZZZZ|nr:hypothetical protein [Actinomycetota bacterium]